MRPTPWFEAEKHRVVFPGWESSHGDDFGWFMVPSPSARGVTLKVLVGPGTEEIPWEHVSVSLPGRCPNWPEMARVKSLFWGDDETVVQFHPPKADYVNVHPNCLHLWKPIGVELPLPPREALA